MLARLSDFGPRRDLSSCRPARRRRGILMIFDAECFDLDVPDKRLRADLIMDKLSQDYSRFFTIESYRWEHEATLASKHGTVPISKNRRTAVGAA
jgi:hypothetical protein